MNLTRIKRLVSRLPALLKETASEWQQDNAMRLAAALAYYTVFSLAPLMLFAIGIAGLVFGPEAATGRIYAELDSVTGPRVASAVQDMVQSADKPSAGYTAAILGFAMGLFGASGVFGELMGSLNQIWGVTSKEGEGIWVWIKGRFLSIGMVMGVCFLMLVSLLANTFLTTVTEYGLRLFPGAAVLGQVAAFILSLAMVTLLFATMFKFLPKTRIEWSDVWTGATVTALLFTLGKFGLEQYMARANPASGYGAAGGLALLLVWVYYSAQIFFFGAEFTEVYARRMGSRLGTPAPSSAAAVAATVSPDEVAADPEYGNSLTAGQLPPAPAPSPPPTGLAAWASVVGMAAWTAAFFVSRRTDRLAPARGSLAKNPWFRRR